VDPASYHLAGKINVGGEGGWDYLTADGAARRLYISHATRTVVVDLDSEKVIGEIGDTQGVHGIAIASKLGRGFTSNGRSNNVTIFDLKTLKTIGQVATGQNPDSIVFDPASGKVFTFNGRSKDSTVIDAASGKVVATIPLGGKPEFSAVNGKGKLWVNNEDAGELIEIDTARLSVTQRIKLTGCEEPSGLAIDTAHTRLFSVCDNKVATVTDPKSGKVLARLPIGEGADGVAFDPGAGLAFSSNGQGNLTVIGEKNGKYAVLATVPTQPGARTIAVDPTTHKLYLPTAQFAPAPAPKAGQGRVRPQMLPGTFTVLVVAP
jgi:YVTN family beta-propeller protein